MHVLRNISLCDFLCLSVYFISSPCVCVCGGGVRASSSTYFELIFKSLPAAVISWSNWFSLQLRVSREIHATLLCCIKKTCYFLSFVYLHVCVCYRGTILRVLLEKSNCHNKQIKQNVCIEREEFSQPQLWFNSYMFIHGASVIWISECNIH